MPPLSSLTGRSTSFLYELLPRFAERLCGSLSLNVFNAHPWIPPATKTDYELAADIFGIEKLAKELGVSGLP